MFTRKWSLVLAALITAFAVLAGARALSAADGGPQAARSSSNAASQTIASAERSSWS
jgi:hypothetical protein